MSFRRLAFARNVDLRKYAALLPEKMARSGLANLRKRKLLSSNPTVQHVAMELGVRTEWLTGEQDRREHWADPFRQARARFMNWAQAVCEAAPKLTTLVDLEAPVWYLSYSADEWIDLSQQALRQSDVPSSLKRAISELSPDRICMGYGLCAFSFDERARVTGSRFKDPDIAEMEHQWKFRDQILPKKDIELIIGTLADAVAAIRCLDAKSSRIAMAEALIGHLLARQRWAPEAVQAMRERAGMLTGKPLANTPRKPRR